MTDQFSTHSFARAAYCDYYIASRLFRDLSSKLVICIKIVVKPLNESSLRDRLPPLLVMRGEPASFDWFYSHTDDRDSKISWQSCQKLTGIGMGTSSALFFFCGPWDDDPQSVCKAECLVGLQMKIYQIRRGKSILFHPLSESAIRTTRITELHDLSSTKLIHP